MKFSSYDSKQEPRSNVAVFVYGRVEEGIKIRAETDLVGVDLI